MQDEQLVIAEDDPVLGSEFATELVRQMRAIDAYGTYDDWPPHRILDPFVLTKERLRDLPLVGDPDEVILARLQAFYNAIAAMIERECGLRATPIISLSHEGFGRAVMTVGKLVVMDRALRDVHRFGFPSLSKMKTEADKHLSVALEIIGDYPQVAGL